MEKNLYKKMMMKSFIKASNEIMKEDGIESITIRKVASKVSVNSATIYNHFDNLEHLKIFSCLSCFDNYIKDLSNYIDESKSIEFNYLKVWECFINHTIENIDVFYALFFNNLDNNFEDYLKEYYGIFPISIDKFDSSILNMLSKSSLEKRNEILLLEMCKKNKISSESISWINNLSIFSYESLLYRIYRNKLDKDEGRKQMNLYISNILKENMVKDID